MDVTTAVIERFTRVAARLETRAADPRTDNAAAERLQRTADRYNRAVRYGWRRIARGV